MLSERQTLLLSAVMLLAALGGVLAYLLARQRRQPLRFMQIFWYAVNYVVARIVWRARVSGPLPIPSDKGAVIICNHRSSLDPSFIEVTTNRVVHWMVAREFFDRPVLSWFLRLAEAIPVGRGGIDNKATKMAIRYAQNGGLVGLFPEGRINQTDQVLLPGRPGAVMIALRARVPVIPCYIHGAPYDGTPLGCLLMSAKVRLVIGPPVDLSEFYGLEDDREVLEELTRRFLRAIATLAGRPEFEPQVAGRFYKPVQGN